MKLTHAMTGHSSFFVILLLRFVLKNPCGASPFVPRRQPHTLTPTNTHFNERSLSTINSKQLLSNERHRLKTASPIRGGGQLDPPSPPPHLETTVSSILQLLTSAFGTVIPPAVALARVILNVYRRLPTDAIIAQTGIVYCFAGGYYPTLFAAVQAARTCGWDEMIRAVHDLTTEATIAISAATTPDDETTPPPAEKTKGVALTVLKSIDPIKINRAVGSLYATWMGVESTLSREFARTITLSLSIADALRPVSRYVVCAPLYVVTPEDYHKWIPVLVGWGCKAVAMSLAWRIQRVLSAGASAVVGGLMFSRALFRMAARRGWTLRGLVKENHEEMVVDDVLGYLVAGVGLHSQITSQLENGFRFEVPYPLSLVTWPFDLAERWIQWHITKRSAT